MNRARLTTAIAVPVIVAAGVAVGLTVTAAPGSAPGPSMHSLYLIALAGPVGGRHDTFRIAELIDPTIIVSAGPG